MKFLERLSHPNPLAKRADQSSVTAQNSHHRLNDASGTRLPPTSATELAQQAPAPENLLSERIDEAALLFSSEQDDAAIAVLNLAISEPARPTTEKEKLAWHMLLELYQAKALASEFDRVALAYAQRFETSPPQWQAQPQSAHPSHLALLRINGNLCGPDLPDMATLPPAAIAQGALRLEVEQLKSIDLAGCQAMLMHLQRWRNQGIRVEAEISTQVSAALRSLIQQGRRDSDDSAWLLLIELFRLAHDSEAYEDCCAAFSLTYEMSAPIAPPEPDLHHTASIPINPHLGCELPAHIHLPVATLLQTLKAARTESGLILDARHLQRIDFHAANHLLLGLQTIVDGKTVEWREISHLVSTLLQLMGSSLRMRFINRPL